MGQKTGVVWGRHKVREEAWVGPSRRILSAPASVANPPIPPYFPHITNPYFTALLITIFRHYTPIACNAVVPCSDALL